MLYEYSTLYGFTLGYCTPTGYRFTHGHRAVENRSCLRDCEPERLFFFVINNETLREAIYLK